MKLFGKRKQREAFDFKRLKDVDDATVEAFFSATHEGSRRLPLLVAGWVYAEIEAVLTTPGRQDALRMSELRGGMMALRKFAECYRDGIESWKKRKRQ